MKHLTDKKSLKKKGDQPRKIDIKKILILSSIGIGIYLLFTRKAQAAEIPEEFTPSEKPQDQLTKELYEQLPPSTIMEQATEIAAVVIKKATEEANIEIQQIKEATATTIAGIIKKANEDLEALKKEMEASTMNLEDAMREYRARDEVVRAEAEQKIELARIEAEKKDQAVRDEAAQKVEVARIEAEQKVEVARIETARIEAARLAEIEAARIEAEKHPILLDSTIHTYIGVSNGSGRLSIDGYFDTFQGEGAIGQNLGNGDFIRKCISQHTWDKPRTITSITYRMRTQAATAGVQNDSFEYDQKIEYTTDGVNWMLVEGTRKNRSGGANTCYGGDACIIAQDKTISVNLIGCKGIRAYTYTHVTENDGHLWAGNEIYEIQVTAIP